MIHINDLEFRYKKKRPLFDGLDISIEPGRIYGLLGRNGAGKTTLLRLLGGLLFPRRGEIEVNSHLPHRRHPAFLSDVFFMPEELYVPNQSVHRFLTNYAPFYPRFNQEQFDHFLGSFGISRADNIRHLSYGQKKKVMLGFGLASGASLLILDEPTNGLDIPSKSRFRQMMAEAITPDRTIIISTHQVRDVSSLIESVIVLDEGRILFQDSLAAISKVLDFRITPREPVAGSSLYAERVPGGYLTIGELPAGTDSEQEVDLEIFFNALISNHQTISRLFQKQLA